MRTFRVFALFGGTLIGVSACHKPAASPGAVSGTREPELRASARAESQSTGELQGTEGPPGLKPAARGIRIPAEFDDPDRWLFAEKTRKGAPGGWASGSFDPRRNKLDIRTHDLREFAIDVSRIPINWKRLVVIGIDGVNAELRKRDYSVLNFQLNEHGQWVVIEP